MTIKKCCVGGNWHVWVEIGMRDLKNSDIYYYGLVNVYVTKCPNRNCSIALYGILT